MLLDTGCSACIGISPEVMAAVVDTQKTLILDCWNDAYQYAVVAKSGLTLASFEWRFRSQPIEAERRPAKFSQPFLSYNRSSRRKNRLLANNALFHEQFPLLATATQESSRRHSHYAHQNRARVAPEWMYPEKIAARIQDRDAFLLRLCRLAT